MYLHLMQVSVTTKVIRLPRGTAGHCATPPRARESARCAVQPPLDAREVMPLAARRLVLEVAPERELRAREGDLGPGDVRRAHQHDFEALGAAAVARGRDAGTEEHVHLLGVQYVHHREERADLDLGQRLLA